MNVRATLAFAFLLGAVFLLIALAHTAWQAVKTLPDRDVIERAANTASDGLSLTRIGGLSSAGNRNSSGADARGIRYVDGNGIVAARTGGELERLPAKLAYGPPPQPPREAQEYKLVVIQSAGIVDARSHTITLDHIDAPAADLVCEGASGTSWPCGRRARTALRRLVRRRSIFCLDEKIEQTEAGENRISSCTVGGADMSSWLVERGWAVPTADAPDSFHTAHASAKNLGLGLYHRNPR